MLLEQIREPQDIQGMNAEELKELAEEIRQFLIEKISVTGGHLASNLGVVELTIALYLACGTSVLYAQDFERTAGDV